ncbi:DUF6763 family protein [Immundisolibacter sp.]|uniref:DUF6763 family protein n=1 Tax=Immundisolibacter sp. TaxID=1934948 RepID=UPI003566115E
MSTEMDPIVGNWYQHIDQGLDFEVVAIDEQTTSVEIQYLDGTLDEISLEDWYELNLDPAEPPEDWTGPLDPVEADDTDFTEPDVEDDEWEEPGAGPARRRGHRDGLADDPPPEGLGGDWDE